VQLERHGQKDRSGDRQEVRGEQEDACEGGDHRREDRVARERERAVGDQRGPLGGVDADPPSVAHRELREHRHRDTCGGERDSKDPGERAGECSELVNDPCQLQCRAGDTHHDRAHEQQPIHQL
jgi:hypothetical protein